MERPSYALSALRVAARWQPARSLRERGAARAGRGTDRTNCQTGNGRCRAVRRCVRWAKPLRRPRRPAWPDEPLRQQRCRRRRGGRSHCYQVSAIGRWRTVVVVSVSVLGYGPLAMQQRTINAKRMAVDDNKISGAHASNRGAETAGAYFPKFHFLTFLDGHESPNFTTFPVPSTRRGTEKKICTAGRNCRRDGRRTPGAPEDGR